jgi:DNA sulfur modification protein DndD
MIFSELILHNFGIYRGRHIVDLKPKSQTKPIILLGGLNGGGKTTFLDALQLALYGNRADCSNKGDLSYSEYLKQAVNRYSDKSEGASIELAFTHFKQGEEIEYRVRRIWRDTGKRTLQDNVEVVVNGKLDNVLSNHWAENVEEFIPNNISSLFFFDGEKIEDLANTESSANIIRTGIQSLLGLDVVDKLTLDLKTIERRRLKAVSDEGTDSLISLIEDEVVFLQANIKEKNIELAKKNSEIDSFHSQIKKTKESYRTHGGDLFDQKEALEEKHKYNQKQLNWISEDIRKFTEGSSPLLLVKDLLLKAKKQEQKEHKSFLGESLVEEIEARDNEILEKIKNQKLDKGLIDQLNKILTDDIDKRKSSIVEDSFLNIPPDSLSHFDAPFFKNISKEAKQLSEKYQDTLEELSHSDKEISSIPELGIIQDISEQLQLANKKLILAEDKSKRLTEEVDGHLKQLDNKQAELDRAFHNANEKQLSGHRNKQILSHTEDVKKTLDIFRKSLVEKHIGHLESLIEDSFKSLIRKNDLIDKIAIDAELFTLDVLDQSGDVIPSNRLSAGERQLLAISVLWGLAKASGRPLPAIIDTPLGRLDSEHRELLIENYFPNASHQVILLSTDTEIDAQYRDMLKKSIGKEYHIQYSPKDKTSTVTQGYF